MISGPARIHIGMGIGVIVLVGGMAVAVSAFPGVEVVQKTEPIAGCLTNSKDDLAIGAKAVYAEDIATGRILYEQNSHSQLPLASITKVMTAITAAQILSEDGVAVVTREALEPEGSAGLYENESWAVGDLIDFTLVTSANDGAHALALAASSASGKDASWFVDEMNANAGALGMTGTFFVNDTGLDLSSTTAGAYGSAHDVAKMIAYAVTRKGTVFEGSADAERTFVSLSQKTHTVTNTSSIAASLAGLIASKTGFTDLAGGNLVAAFEPIPGRPIAAAILGGERETRDLDMLVLAERATRELKRIIRCESAYAI